MKQWRESLHPDLLLHRLPANHLLAYQGYTAKPKARAFLVHLQMARVHALVFHTPLMQCVELSSTRSSCFVAYMVESPGIGRKPRQHEGLRSSPYDELVELEEAGRGGGHRPGRLCRPADPADLSRRISSVGS